MHKVHRPRMCCQIVKTVFLSTSSQKRREKQHKQHTVIIEIVLLIFFRFLLLYVLENGLNFEGRD